MSRGFVRGGSSSIFSSSKEDTAEDDVNLENVLVSNNNTNKNMVGNTSMNHNKNGSTSTVPSATATTTTSSSSSNVKVNGTSKIPTNISIEKNGYAKLKKDSEEEIENINQDSAGQGKIPLDSCMVEADQHIPTKHVAETNLPTDIGHFRLRAYRVEEKMQELLQNEHFGTEPCVIYATDKPPFGQVGVPVRIHDQCFTSEVFRSQRYVPYPFVCLFVCASDGQTDWTD
jgi:hypothetical protein